MPGNGTASCLKNHFFLRCFLGLLMVITRPATAAFRDSPAIGPYAGSLGAGASTALFRSAYVQNPASLQTNSFGLEAYSYSPFGIEELRDNLFAAYYDFDKIGLGLTYTQFGFSDLYNEKSLQFQNSWNSPYPVTLGYSLGIRHLEIQSLGWELDRSLALGIVWQAASQLKLGIYTRRRFFEEIKSKEAWVSGLGFSLGKLDQIGLDLDLELRPNEPKRVRLSQRLPLGKSPSFLLQGALANRPFQMALGMTWQFQGFHFHGSRISHSDLGPSYHWGLGWTE